MMSEICFCDLHASDIIGNIEEFTIYVWNMVLPYKVSIITTMWKFLSTTTKLKLLDQTCVKLYHEIFCKT